MNSFRTETFNISKTGRTESFFIQGGQRWQSITLLTNCSLTLSGVGFRPSNTIKPVDSLPGAFNASDAKYHPVWSLGARSVQAACLEPGTQPSTWEVTSDGAFIRGQYPAQSALGKDFGNYTLTFSTKVVRGGTGWKVAGAMSTSYGPYFLLTSNGPTYANTNSTLMPKNTLVAGFGFTFVNQTILESGPVRYYDLPSSLTISDDEWYRVTTAINSTGYLISVNDTQVAFVDSAFNVPHILSGWGINDTTDGTFSFGPYLDQAAYVKDVEVKAQNGSVIYTNSMTTNEVYKEYSIATNDRKVCLDGAKRDRVVWIGDFSHTGRILAASSGRFDYVESMIELEFDWQYPPGPAYGLVPIQSFMGAGAKYREAFYPSQFGEDDYQHFFLLVLTDYYKLTNDKALLSKHWNGTKLLVQTLTNRYVDPVSGLLARPGSFWFTAQGFQNATAPTALFAVGLNQLAEVATQLNDSATADSYTSLSAKLASAINHQLWSDELGAYALCLDGLNETSLLANAFSIRAGIANTTQATRGIQKLSDLFYKIGYKDSSAIPNGNTTQLSPNIQGFLLESLFLAHTQLNVSADVVVPVIKDLLDFYWPKMVNQNQYSTGCPWEYVYPDGSPGIGIFTSLCHPWGGAPTYIFNDFVLGVRRELDQKSNSYQWVFDPVWEIVEGLGLEWANGRAPIFGGGHIEAEWRFDKGAKGKNKKPNMKAKVVGNKDIHVHVKNYHG